MATDTAYLKQRRQTWYLQIAVPTDVQEALGDVRGHGKPVRVLVWSLGTRDKGEAQRRRWDKHRDALDLFDRLRGKNALTVAEMEEAAEATLRRSLADAQHAAERGRPLGLAPEQVAGDDGELTLSEPTEYGGLEIRLDHLMEALAEDDFTDVVPRAQAVVERTGSNVPVGSRAWRELCESQLRALIEATKGRMAFLQGKSYEPERPFTTPIIDPVELTVRHSAITRRRAPSTGGEKFVDATARYVAEMMRDPSAAWTEQTKGQYETTYRLFGDYLNGAAAASVTRDDAIKFLDEIASLHPYYGRHPSSKELSFAALLEKYGEKGAGLTNKTLNRHTTALTSFFKWAKRGGLYEGVNPFSEMTRKIGRASSRGYLPLNEEELERLIKSDLLCGVTYEERVRPASHSINSALMWVPLIALFSGMRSEEICQLRSADDVNKNDGVWFFNVAEGEGQRVKTEAGIRQVPVHSNLIKIGFLDYVEHARRDPSGLLFPGLKPGGPDHKLNWYFTRRVGTYFTRIGITRPRVTFHSLRKNVVQALEHAGVQQSDTALIVGHERGFTYSRYNPGGLKLPRLRRIVEKIRYPRLSLAHLAAP